MIAAVNSRPMTDQTFMIGFLLRQDDAGRCTGRDKTDAMPAAAPQARRCLLQLWSNCPNPGQTETSDDADLLSYCTCQRPLTSASEI